MGACYLLEFPSGKVYVGITTKTAAARFVKHCWDARHRTQRPVYHAIRKYGPDSITVHTLAESEDWMELCQYERMFIAFYGSNERENGYNLTSGGEGVPDPSEEVREKMRVVSRDNWTDPEYRERVSAGYRAARRTQWDDPKYREKMTATNRDRWYNSSPEYRERFAAAAREAGCRRKARDLAAFDASIPDYGEDAGFDVVPLDFVESVRVAILRHPLGYRQLSRTVEVSGATIHNFATRRCHPTDATLRRLAEALGVAE